MVSADRALLDAVRRQWVAVNTTRFGGALHPPVLELGDGTGKLGTWSPDGRVLTLSRRLARTRPWGEVVSVLEHEMAHQYVSEVLGVHDEPPHGHTFRAVCAERGIDARAGGVPAGAPRALPPVVRRIRKLLALADSPVESEARAAMRMAHRLMLRHNVALVDAEDRPAVRVVQVGEVRARRPRHEQLLAGILSSRFFVDVTLVPAFHAGTGRAGRAVELVGTEDNVEIAVWVWDYVLGTAERLWSDHRVRSGLPGRERQRYLQGVMLGLRDKLDEEARAAEQEEALVWVGDPAVEAFTDARYGGRRRGRRFRMQGSEAMAAGRAAGRDIVLRRPLRARRGGAVRALTDRRRDG